MEPTGRAVTILKKALNPTYDHLRNPNGVGVGTLAIAQAGEFGAIGTQKVYVMLAIVEYAFDQQPFVIGREARIERGECFAFKGEVKRALAVQLGWINAAVEAGGEAAPG